MFVSHILVVYIVKEVTLWHLKEYVLKLRTPISF